MTDMSTSVPAAASRSLWQDAMRRLRRNKAAMASIFVLVLFALAAIFGPMVSPHPPEKIYQQYVRVAPSLQPYPHADTVLPSFEKEFARTRLDGDTPVFENGTLTINVASRNEDPIDERVLRYFQRSDVFTSPTLSPSADGKTGVLSVKVEQNYFLLGTDNLGRDMLTRILSGLRISLSIGLLASVMALVLGVIYGATSGYLGGRTDNVMMRFVDILYSLPFIFFVILMLVFFGRSILIIFIAIGFTEWLDMARIVRGQTLSLKRREFVQAAEALGSSKAGIIARHIIPNALGPVIIFMTLLVPKAILLESLLSFLGLGVQDPMTSLGVLISEGAKNMRGAVYQLLFPAGTLTILLFALNFLGDGLRDSLDPKER